MTPERAAFLAACREADPEGLLTYRAMVDAPVGDLWRAHMARVARPLKEQRASRQPVQMELPL